MRTISVMLDGREYSVEVRPVPGDRTRAVVLVDGEELDVYLPTGGVPGEVEWMVVNRRPYELILGDQMHWLQSGAGMHELEVRWADAAGGGAPSRPASGDGRVKAPIPGLINRVLVEPGASVEPGAPLLVLEAMKMEHTIAAPHDGVIADIAAEGAQVSDGAVLVRFEGAA